MLIPLANPMHIERLNPAILSHAAGIIADTKSPLTGTKIIKAMTEYSLKYNVRIPFPEMPDDPVTKKVLLLENLKQFNGPEQYIIIRDLCDHPSNCTEIYSECRQSASSASGRSYNSRPSAFVSQLYPLTGAARLSGRGFINEALSSSKLFADFAAGEHACAVVGVGDFFVGLNPCGSCHRAECLVIMAGFFLLITEGSDKRGAQGLEGGSGSLYVLRFPDSFGLGCSGHWQRSGARFRGCGNGVGRFRDAFQGIRRKGGLDYDVLLYCCLERGGGVSLRGESDERNGEKGESFHCFDSMGFFKVGFRG